MGCQGHITEDSAEVLFQSFRHEVIVSKSGIDRAVHSFDVVHPALFSAADHSTAHPASALNLTILSNKLEVFLGSDSCKTEKVTNHFNTFFLYHKCLWSSLLLTFKGEQVNNDQRNSLLNFIQTSTEFCPIILSSNLILTEQWCLGLNCHHHTIWCPGILLWLNNMLLRGGGLNCCHHPTLLSKLPCRYTFGQYTFFFLH